MSIKIMLDNGAIMPTKAHEADAGWDLYAPFDCEVKGSNVRGAGSLTIDTGVHIELPRGTVGMIKSKSGLNVKHGLTAEGVIDSGYTGSICVKLYNYTDKPYRFKGGEKIAQLVIMPIVIDGFEITDCFPKTDRGNGGFGSSGK